MVPQMVPNGSQKTTKMYQKINKKFKKNMKKWWKIWCIKTIKFPRLNSKFIIFWRKKSDHKVDFLIIFWSIFVAFFDQKIYQKSMQKSMSKKHDFSWKNFPKPCKKGAKICAKIEEFTKSSFSKKRCFSSLKPHILKVWVPKCH